MSVLLCLAGATLSALVGVGAWRRRRRMVASVLAVLSGLLVLEALATLPESGLAALAVIVGVAVLRAAVLLQRRARSASTVSRWGERARRKAGVASTLDVLHTASAPAVRRRGTVVRPSLQVRSRLEQASTPTTEVALPLCRVGLLRVWSLLEDVVCVFGGPRTGKTGWLAGRVLDAPGAAVVTSTRTDLYELTRGLRARRGPVHVFNAVGLGGIASTVCFDPLQGCEDPVTAAERATDLLAAGSVARAGDREYWEAQARRVLAAFLHAAALGGRGMQAVLAWVADPDEHEHEVTSLLRMSPVPSFVQGATQFLTTNERTRSSITSTVMPALGWLTSPAASAAASGRGGRPALDVAELLRTRATIYLLGAEETQAAPLVCALTGHIAREARRLAARKPGGRLDPPLLLALDEAALISPVPLESWTADMGGRGVAIVAAFQSRAQLISRWGETGAAIILNNTASVMVFGGTRDRDDLDYWSALAGERDEPVATTDEHGAVLSRTVRRVPVIAPAQLANLPFGRVLLIRRGMPPVIGRVRMAWKRRDVRTHTRASRAAAWDGWEAQTEPSPARREVSHPVLPSPTPPPIGPPRPAHAAAEEPAARSAEAANRVRNGRVWEVRGVG
ncbi:type IV secretory system conjugative DNA transfer family protein [Pseudonocardia sp. WMMC193]|uniref:type IV secretory system conjugative DNA transfer family protein n=1 Tax=Pseudonocardia sp. WMMC193 TaxID=2911965 RepID=UPI001F19214F|nr:TraM recognition domain-containing protein [Pseudonocardia sp. WMMC193]MCF7552246.1 TraM recognition domain-containing protein [Pseudonocardia sp. WMMC193]